MKGFIFDLDGTLLDTLEDIGNACNEVLEAHGYPVHSLKSYRWMVGNGFVTLIRRALPPTEVVRPEFIGQLVEEARDIYADHLIDKTVPYPGIPQALAELVKAGCLLSVLSNKPDDLSDVLMRHFFADIPFKIVQGAKPDVPLKPDPNSLLDIIGKMRVDKKQCGYVGDSNVDVLTARNAHIASIGVTWGFRTEEELRSSGATRLIDRPEELLALTGGRV